MLVQTCRQMARLGVRFRVSGKVGAGTDLQADSHVRGQVQV